MFYQEYLEAYKDSSEAFKHFLYWCVSEDQKPTFARSRKDVPYAEILSNLNDKELELAQKLLRERSELQTREEDQHGKKQ